MRASNGGGVRGRVGGRATTCGRAVGRGVRSAAQTYAALAFKVALELGPHAALHRQQVGLGARPSTLRRDVHDTPLLTFVAAPLRPFAKTRPHMALVLVVVVALYHIHVQKRLQIPVRTQSNQYFFLKKKTIGESIFKTNIYKKLNLFQQKKKK